MYHLLWLADMKIGGIDKVKYFVHHIDRLLPQSIDEIFEKWKSDSCPALKLKLACDSDLDFDLLKSMGGLTTTRLEIGIVLSVFLYIVQSVTSCTSFSSIGEDFSDDSDNTVGRGSDKEDDDASNDSMDSLCQQVKSKDEAIPGDDFELFKL